ncbi:MAG: DUF1993 domain-containing protein [Sphingomonas bacterium]|nr:DUF1993 domain-containing protein [Sphingomonas bacterium]
MSFSLYDATIPSNLQILRSLDALLDKAEAFCSEGGQEPDAILDAKIADDMLPFGYQVKSCVAHSLGAVEATRKGSFSPDMKPWPDSFAGLHAAVRSAIEALEKLDPADVDALVDSDTEFRFGETVMPFTGANFLLSFAQPNFYFHATTAYAILRAKGVKIGKRDFLGMPRIKR